MPFGRTTAAILLATALLVGPSAASARAPLAGNADSMLFWARCDQVAALTDHELDEWHALGVDGFVCQTRWLRGLGGTQDFTGDRSASLASANYEFQRTLRDTGIVQRAADRGMKLYLGTYMANYFNRATPLAPWFDDERWQPVLGKLRDLSGAARSLGFAGVALDQELYPQQGGHRTATWKWAFPGNHRPEAEVRSIAERRGREVMTALLEGFPRLDIVFTDFRVPGSWNEHFAERLAGARDPYTPLVQLDFWDGMTSVEGYGTIRYLNGAFQKTTHLNAPWDAAFTYDANQLFAQLSRRFSNWDYAHSHFAWSPFPWLNEGIDPGTYDDSRPPGYVADQFEAISRWSMEGEFVNFVYGGLDLSDYDAYADTLRRSSTAGPVEDARPTLATGRSKARVRRSLRGTAHDDLALRAVAWRDDRGGKGAAKLKWTIRGGDERVGYDWITRWRIPRGDLSPGARKVSIRAIDIKDQHSPPATLRIARPKASG